MSLLPDHGANPHYVYERFGLNIPENRIDFSENCHPYGPPQAVYEQWSDLLASIRSYPDPTADPFRTAVATYHAVPKEQVYVGNGAAELFVLLAERYRSKRVLIVHPTFSEYEATLRPRNVEIVRLIAREEEQFQLPLAKLLELLPTVNAVYLCTPNNPTGYLPKKEVLQTVVEEAGRVGCEVVLDEAFIDFVDEGRSFISSSLYATHLIIVRSMTKMYTIPGLRLGYLVASPSIIQAIRSFASHWHVNALAAVVGELCLQQTTYRQEAIKYAKEEREKMALFLQAHQCRVLDSETNFITFAPPPPHQTHLLYYDLLQRGMILRHTENFIGMNGNWLRVGMKRTEEMEALRKEMSRWFEEN